MSLSAYLDQDYAADVAGWSEFVENQLWVRSGVVFSMIHVVGSHNNLDPWTGIDSGDSLSTPRADRLAEYNRRLQAVLAWIEVTFETAAEVKARGRGAAGWCLVITKGMPADIRPVSTPTDSIEDMPLDWPRS